MGNGIFQNHSGNGMGNGQSENGRTLQRRETLVSLICRLDNEVFNLKPCADTRTRQKKEFFFSSMKWNPAPQARVSSDSVSKSHAAFEVDNYFADVVSDDEINPLKYWKINSGRFPLLSKLATLPLWRELKEFLI